MSTDLRRLRDAAAALRTVQGLADGPRHTALFGAVAEWLEDTASRAAYTIRSLDLLHARRVADAILGEQPTSPPQPLTDEPCGVTPTPAGLDYLASRRQHPRGEDA